MARTFTIRMADLVIEITALYNDTYALCSDYLADAPEQPDFSIATDQASIDYEREQDKLGDFPDAYYETLAVYRKIAEELPRFGRLLVHGSAVAIGERAWLFMATSGTGKSTHTRWWRTEFSDEAPFMVNDDKPIIRLADDGVLVYGTPWDGKEHLSTNTCVQLAGIGLLERAEEDWALPADAWTSFSELMRFTYRPFDAAAARATIQTLLAVSERVPLYRVGVTDSAHAAHVTRAAMAI